MLFHLLYISHFKKTLFTLLQLKRLQNVLHSDATRTIFGSPKGPFFCFNNLKILFFQLLVKQKCSAGIKCYLKNKQQKWFFCNIIQSLYFQECILFLETILNPNNVLIRCKRISALPPSSLIVNMLICKEKECRVWMCTRTTAAGVFVLAEL